MAGFISYDDIINAITTKGQYTDVFFAKTGSVMQAAGSWHRTWIAVGAPTGAAAEPSATPGDIYNTNTNSITFPAVSTAKRALLTFGGVSSQSTTLMLYDRLTAVGGLSSASTGAKTVNSGALPRYSGTAATNVQCWLEVTTASTTTVGNCHLNSYTEDGGGTGIVGGSQIWPGAAVVKDCMIGPMPLASTSKGVRSVEVGIQIDTANTAGVFNLVLMRPLGFLPLFAGIWTERDFVLQLASLPQIFDTASLGIAMLATATTAQNIWGQIRTAYN